MLQKNDLERSLKIWGPIKSPISKKSIELWGKTEPESVIDLYIMYIMLSKSLAITERVSFKRGNKSRTGGH